MTTEVMTEAEIYCFALLAYLKRAENDHPRPFPLERHSSDTLDPTQSHQNQLVDEVLACFLTDPIISPDQLQGTQQFWTSVFTPTDGQTTVSPDIRLAINYEISDDNAIVARSAYLFY